MIFMMIKSICSDTMIMKKRKFKNNESVIPNQGGLCLALEHFFSEP